MEWLALMLLLTVASVAGHTYVEQKYVVSTSLGALGQGALGHLTIDKNNGRVFVGATNRLYMFHSNLTAMREIVTGPRLDNPDCGLRYYQNTAITCNEEQRPMNSYSKALVIDYDNKTLISCSSLFHGYCSIFSLDLVKIEDKPLPIVANNATATTFLFIAPGPAPEPPPEPQETADGRHFNALYCGVSRTNNGESTRNYVPAFCSRNLSTFEVPTVELRSSKIQIEILQRQTFYIHYIYGFYSGNFSYMITVQRQSPQSESYITKIFRVCVNDRSFYSYTEVQLECMHDGTLYNLAQAAYLGKAGSRFAGMSNITVDDDVLYVVFSTGQHNSAQPLRDSALCVYPLQVIGSKFTENIRECFRGIGRTGPAHIVSPSSCQDTQFVIDENYCGAQDVNNPIDGDLPITAQASTTFAHTASAVTVSTAFGYTVVFIGTSNGHLLKVVVDSTTAVAKPYEDVDLDEGNKINANMYLDSSAEYLYVMTTRMILKMKLHDCSQYKTCADCLGVRDPYCGWCALEYKCTQRTECAGDNQELRWLSYNGRTCAGIESIEPPQIQIERDKTTTLKLNISNLPNFTGEYQCQFSGYGVNIRMSNTPQREPSSGRIHCQTPDSHRLPGIPTDEDHIVMKLSILINGRSFVSTNFAFYDCSLHKACTGCTLSAFPCSWCVNNHMCTHDKTLHCLDNHMVEGKNALATGGEVGPEACPRIELLHPDSKNKILVPSGTDMITIELKAVHLLDFLQPLKCFFNLDHGKEVAAKITEKDSGHIVECGPVTFQYSENTPRMNVPFEISWADGSWPLDNPGKIQVIMYKCDSMADTCGDCLKMDEDYMCGWCGDSCSINAHCSSQWLLRTATCPNPVISRIEPLAGPKAGGTLLTIYGKNLGQRYEDILGGITVAEVTCEPQKKAYDPPTKIVCKTGHIATTQNGHVRVLINAKYVAISDESFSYVDPVMERVSPNRGPVAGGTQVTISGRNLDAGTKLFVYVGGNQCEVIGRVSSSIVCKTSPSKTIVKDIPDDYEEEIFFTAEFDLQSVRGDVLFIYVNNPQIHTAERKDKTDPKSITTDLKSIVHGGIRVDLAGRYLDTVQVAQMFFQERHTTRRKRSIKYGTKYFGDCELASSSTTLTCYTPTLPVSLVPLGGDGVELNYGFKLDNVVLYGTKEDPSGVFTVYSDPIFEEFPGNKEKSYESKTVFLTLNGQYINLALKNWDYQVFIGNQPCEVTSAGSQLTCKPPKQQPKSLEGRKFPEVVVYIGRNQTKTIGYLKYEKPEVLSMTVIIGLLVAGGILVIVIISFIIYFCVKKRETRTMKKMWQIRMDTLEGKVAKECKEAFADLLTDMTELASDHLGQVAIPFWDYRTYCMRILFPQNEDSHPVIRDLEVDYAKRDQVENGLRLFAQLISNKTFLLNFIRTLEANPKFTMRDRVNVASLISVALQTKMEYATEILKTLLAELIEKQMDGKNHPKLLLRRTESIAEKMLTNWFTFLLYKFLRECAGEPLFMLYQSIKQQTCKGPVDSVTFEARYSLSEDKLIRQQVDYSSMTVYVQDLDQFKSSHPVKVLDCDTISQVKEKILDAIYKNAPFSSRPVKESIDLVLFAQSPPELNPDARQRMILSDIDSTSKQEGDYKRLNTLAHYKVPDGAFMALTAMQTPSIYNMSNTSEKSSNKNWDYQRLDNSVQYTGRSPSLNRTTSPQNVQVDMDHNQGNGVKYFHLVKQHDTEGAKEGDRGSKMVSEIYLTRLLATKVGTLHKFVDDLFSQIFSTTHRSTVLPLAIKYMFDFLDDQARLHKIQDTDIVHTWKSNSLPLRFWVNVIKNPNFVFDIYKSNIVDSCLSVVAQTFMDSCSMSEHKLGKDSPSSKLLYAKDIPQYKEWVERYYQDIKMIPAISDQDMTAMMVEESRAHQDEFNTNAALYELYKYVQLYNDDIVESLGEDEFARKYRLTTKLEQIQEAMDGEVYC